MARTESIACGPLTWNLEGQAFGPLKLYATLNRTGAVMTPIATGFLADIITQVESRHRLIGGYGPLINALKLRAEAEEIIGDVDYFIGVLNRKGMPIYYGAIDDTMTERADRDVLRHALRAAAVKGKKIGFGYPGTVRMGSPFDGKPQPTPKAVDTPALPPIRRKRKK